MSSLVFCFVAIAPHHQKVEKKNSRKSLIRNSKESTLRKPWTLCRRRRRNRRNDREEEEDLKGAAGNEPVIVERLLDSFRSANGFFFLSFQVRRKLFLQRKYHSCRMLVINGVCVEESVEK